jgi:hypothetical protein
MPQALPDKRNMRFPRDTLTQPTKPVGDKRDSAVYMAKPGVEFYRPWISNPNGRSFVWPGGVEGFTCRIDPNLGIYRFLGGNAVAVDVTHRGQETITLGGVFPGYSSVDAFLTLRDLVYEELPDHGFILYVPHLFTHTQRVFVQHASFDHPSAERTRDLTYSIDFIKVATGSIVKDPRIPTMIPNPGHHLSPRGKPARVFVANAKINTLRKVARAKLKNAKRWDELYRKNEKFFKKNHVAMHKVPDYRLPQGTKIRF